LAANNRGDLANEVCEMLIAGTADVDAKDRWHLFFEFAIDFVMYFVFEVCF
jgi:hypothetical protein